MFPHFHATSGFPGRYAFLGHLSTRKNFTIFRNPRISGRSGHTAAEHAAQCCYVGQWSPWVVQNTLATFTSHKPVTLILTPDWRRRQTSQIPQYNKQFTQLGHFTETHTDWYTLASQPINTHPRGEGTNRDCCSGNGISSPTKSKIPFTTAFTLDRQPACCVGAGLVLNVYHSAASSQRMSEIIIELTGRTITQ